VDRHEPYETEPEDDWFAEPAPVGRREDDWPTAPRSVERPPLGTQERAQPDNWLAPGDLEPPGRRRGRGRDDRRFLAAAAAALAVALLIGLAAAGVFSGGGSPSPTTSRSATTRQSSPSTTPARSSVPAPATTLAPGDTGTTVKTLQRALAALGFSPGAADGDYGSATKKAVADFQRANGLTADGVFGPKTLAALKQALAAAG
jgi:hypothetical protein